MFTEIQHETGYESGGELVHPQSVLKQTCDDFKDKTDTFVKVAMQFFSKGCAWQKELCENVISILFAMITYRGKLMGCIVNIRGLVDAMLAHPKYQNIHKIRNEKCPSSFIDRRKSVDEQTIWFVQEVHGP